MSVGDNCYGKRVEYRLENSGVLFSFFFFSNIYLFIYFLAALGLSCGTWDLLLQCAGFSLVVERRLSCPSACGILVP